MAALSKRRQRAAIERWTEAASSFERTVQTLESWHKLASENAAAKFRHKRLMADAFSIKQAMQQIRDMVKRADEAARGLLPHGKQLSEVPFLTSAIIALMDGSIEVMREFQQRARLEMQVLAEFAGVPKEKRASFPLQNYSALPMPSKNHALFNIGIRGAMQHFFGDLLRL